MYIWSSPMLPIYSNLGGGRTSFPDFQFQNNSSVLCENWVNSIFIAAEESTIVQNSKTISIMSGSKYLHDFHRLVWFFKNVNSKCIFLEWVIQCLDIDHFLYMKRWLLVKNIYCLFFGCWELSLYWILKILLKKWTESHFIPFQYQKYLYFNSVITFHFSSSLYSVFSKIK